MWDEGQWRIVAMLMLWAVVLGLFVAVAAQALAEEPRVDPCTVNPEACSAEYRRLTPGQRFELSGQPKAESQDRIYRWDDDEREPAPRPGAFTADWEDD